MEWVEAAGKTLEQAKEKALDLLGVAEDDAEFVVLAEAKAGLFGRVKSEARVQARVRPTAPRARRQRGERRDRRSGQRNRQGNRGEGNRAQGNGRGPSGGGRGGTAEKAGSGEEAAGGRSGGSGGSKGSRSRSRKRGSGGPGRPAGAAGATGGVVEGEAAENKQAPSGATGRTREVPQREAPRGAKMSGQESETDMEDSLTLEQQGDAAKEFLAGLVERFGLEADVRVTELDDRTIEVAAVGDNLGLLVGPRGNTLAAVQELARTSVQRQSASRTDRIMLDIGGYREKRAAALARFTAQIAAEVAESGEERALEPMAAADRKVVHDTVNEIAGVRTRSEGEEPRRYIVLEPEA